MSLKEEGRELDLRECSKELAYGHMEHHKKHYGEGLAHGEKLHGLED